MNDSSAWLQRGHKKDDKIIPLLWRLARVGILPFSTLHANIKALGVILILHRISVA